MRRLLIKIRFDGTDYHGWQVQNNAVTVQQRVQDAVEKVFSARLGVTGCSRTDSGVHANMFCFHMDTDSQIPCDRVAAALNTYLPDDIAVYGCEQVAQDFHARYSCKGKTYIYRMYDSPERDPFLSRYAYHSKHKLDCELMNRAAQAYLGSHDFSGFCASGSSVEDRIRRVSESRVERVGDEVTFTVTADGFLYNMVRIMAGTLLDVSAGVISADDMNSIVASADRARAGRTACANGLTLDRVYY